MGILCSRWSNHATKRVLKKMHKLGSLKDRLTSEDRLSFRAKYLEGIENKPLALIFGISTASVKRLVKKMKLPNKNAKAHSGEISQHPVKKSRILKCVELYKEKHSTFEIGKELGINDETVRGYLKRMGVRMRDCGGFTKNMKARQNKIIKKMYLEGAILQDIMIAAKIGKKGLDNRLKKMGIPRNRYPNRKYVGNKFDDEVKQLFIHGSSGKDIAKKLKLSETAICYRIRAIIFKNCDFELSYYSRLFKKWKKMKRTHSPKGLRMQILRLRGYLHYTPKLYIRPIFAIKFRR